MLLAGQAWERAKGQTQVLDAEPSNARPIRHRWTPSFWKIPQGLNALDASFDEARFQAMSDLCKASASSLRAGLERSRRGVARQPLFRVIVVY